MKVSTEGASRLVFIFSDFVVKVPWINLTRLIQRILKHRREGTLTTKIRQRSDPSRPITILMIPLRILWSNRREYLFYQEHKRENILMPTKGFFFGHILVQPRGEVLSRRMRRWKRICNRIKALKINQGDLINPRNFSIIMGRVVLHDFGFQESQEVLMTVGFDSIGRCLR